MRIDVNPFALSLRIQGFELDDKDDVRLVSFGEFFVNFQLANNASLMWNGSLTLAPLDSEGELVLSQLQLDPVIDQPRLVASIKEDGSLNLLDLVPGPDPAAIDEPSAPDRVAWQVGVDELAYATALWNQLLKAETVSDRELSDLAHARAQVIKDAFLSNGQLAENRLVSAAPKEVQSGDEEWVVLELSVASK